MPITDALAAQLDRLATLEPGPFPVVSLADLDASANGIAIFTSTGAGLFEAIQLAAPIDQHRLYVSDERHLYPLAACSISTRAMRFCSPTPSSRALSSSRRTASRRTEQVTGTKTRRHKMGGWSQARYQRATRLQLNLDAYNALNSSSILSVNSTYDARWRQPNSVIDPRLFQVSGQISLLRRGRRLRN